VCFPYLILFKLIGLIFFEIMTRPIVTSVLASRLSLFFTSSNFTVFFLLPSVPASYLPPPQFSVSLVYDIYMHIGVCLRSSFCWHKVRHIFLISPMDIFFGDASASSSRSVAPVTTSQRFVKRKDKQVPWQWCSRRVFRRFMAVRLEMLCGISQTPQFQAPKQMWLGWFHPVIIWCMSPCS
jgi:hypothetical protein